MLRAVDGRTRCGEQAQGHHPETSFWLGGLCVEERERSWARGYAVRAAGGGGSANDVASARLVALEHLVDAVVALLDAGELDRAKALARAWRNTRQ